MIKIPFNTPYIPKGSISEVTKLLGSGKQLSGDGEISQFCEIELKKILNAENNVLLTNSCSSALEISAICSNLNANSEVILPSYTFVATATAFTREKAKIKFCDIDKITGNLCLDSLEKLITKNTKVIVCVHYGGSSCDLDKLLEICNSNNIILIEDCAQGIHGTYKGEKLGKKGDFGCFSFHDTKNISAGEGGCLTINKNNLIKRAQYIRDKGTNRKDFTEKLVNKYHWVDEGSSFSLSEINACLLLHSLKESDEIHRKRILIWEAYFEFLKPLEVQNKIRIQEIPKFNSNAAHLFYFLIDKNIRTDLIRFLRDKGIEATFHYVPLHSSPYGLSYSENVANSLINTKQFAEMIVRLPLRANMNILDCEYICENIYSFFKLKFD